MSAPPALGFPVDPMKATLGTLPTGAGCAFEVKWDGYRTIVHVDAGRPGEAVGVPFEEILEIIIWV